MKNPLKRNDPQQPNKANIMRTILFRGLRTDGKWVYGDLLTNHPHHPNEFVILEGGCINHEIIKETVGQFTGFQDKTGKDVYEGDVVERTVYPRSRLEIKFKDGRFIGCDYMKTQIRIIGNIHDNPDLLK